MVQCVLLSVKQCIPVDTVQFLALQSK